MSQRPFLFCLIPPERADELLGRLVEHFADDSRVAVLVERRAAERQGSSARRAGDDQRARVVARDIVRALPPELQQEARHLRFVQRLEPVRRTHADTDVAELLALRRAGDADAVTELLWRLGERVRLRLRRRLGDVADAEAALDVFGRMLDELDADDPPPGQLDDWVELVVDRYLDERVAGTARPRARRAQAAGAGADQRGRGVR